MLEYFTAALREGDTTSHGEYELRYRTRDEGASKPDHVIEAFHPDHEQAVAKLSWSGRNKRVLGVDVDPAHRRQGLATAMWNWAQEQGRPKPLHSADRTDEGDAWARSVGGTLPRRLSAKQGNTLETGITDYFGGGHGGAASDRRVAGRGKPRRNGGGRQRPAPGSGGGDPASSSPAPAAEGGSVGEGQEGPRPVEFHPRAAKELRKLDGSIQKRAKQVIEALANGGEGVQTHALANNLAGYHSSKINHDHRIVHRPTDGGGIHIIYVGLHDYDQAARRVGAKDAGEFGGTVRMVPPEEYRRFHYPDYPGARTPAALVRHFKKTSPEYYDKIKSKVQEEGFTTPVLVRWNDPRGKPLRKPEVMEGHHRAAVAHELGMHLPVGDYDNPDDYDTAFQAGQPWFRENQRPVEGVPWKEAARKEDLEPHQRAVHEAQEAVRLHHPNLTMPVTEESGTEHLRGILGKHGYPQADEAFVHIHPGVRSHSSTAMDGSTGAMGVALHPARADYGTLLHEAAHLLNDHATGRRFREDSSDEHVHGIGYVQQYAKLLQPWGRKTPGGNYRAGPGDMLLNEYYRSLNRRTAMRKDPIRRCPCGLDVVFDPQDGWQHVDGSVSHDGEHYGKSVSDLMKTAAHPLPTSRVFGPTYGLDHRLFEGEHLKPEVRTAVMARLGPVIEPLLGQDWQRYTKVYLAGSEASEWTSATLEGNGDFDTLIGVDYDALKGEPGIPLAAEDDQDITDALNKALREQYNAEPWKAPFGGEWSLTGYCNAGSYDIRRIKPYAAYNITDDTWAVRPPHLPDWSIEKLPEGGDNLLAEAEGYAAVVDAISKMPEPFQTQQGKALWKHLHSDRGRAFSDEGEGWLDPGNLIEKALVEWGVWDKLVEWQYGRKTAAKLPKGLTFEHRPPSRRYPDDHQLVVHHPDAPHGAFDNYVGHLTWSDHDGEISGAWITQPWQRKGIGTELFRRAKEITPELHHAPEEERSDAGQAWINSLGSTQEPWVEHVRVDKLLPHREWQHQRGGFSYDMEGNGPYAPKHDAESWDANVASVREGGIREPLTLHYNPTQHAAYFGEGNHRLHWAREAGHETVPVRMWRTTSKMPERYKLAGEPKLTKDEHGYFPQDGFKPSDVLPADYFPGQEKTAGAQGDLPDLTYKHLPPEDNHPYGGADQDTHTLHAYTPDGQHAGELSWFGEDGMIRDVSVHPDYRRRGIASELLRRARQIQPGVHHSDALTSDGAGWARKTSMLNYFAVKRSDHPLAPDLPQEQHDALDAEDYTEHKRKMLDLAKNPVPGTHIWRGELRAKDPVKGARETGVGIHWGVNPDTILRPQASDGEHEVVYHAEIEHPGEQNFSRNHSMWNGRHMSMDSEAEVRLKPGTKVKLHGVWYRDPYVSEKGYFTPTKPERMGKQWSYTPINEYVDVAHRPTTDLIDYSDVGIKHEGMLGYFTASDEDETDYRMQHRPPDTDFGSPHHDIGDDVMPDLYDHPEYYAHAGDPTEWEAFSHIRRTRGKPDAKVKIYRALPAEHAHQGFRPGDWVTTSKEYARQHGRESDPKHDWPVISTVVPAKHLQTDGNDLREWGYTGPHKDMPMVSFKGGYHQEIRNDKDGWIKRVKRRTPKTADYRLQHQAPDEDSGQPYHHHFPADPDEEIRIYRAAPPGVNSLHSDTWVTTDPDYAHQHAEQYDGSPKWPVMSTTVPARHLYWDENDGHEFGYQGPSLESRYLEEHDQETGGLQPFRDREGVHDAEASPAAPVPKRRVRSTWGSSVAHLSPQDHADSLMGFTREHANKVLQGMGPVKWAEHHSKAEDDAISGLDEARAASPPGTKPVGVLVRKQDDQITGVQLKHHGGDLPEDHPFAGVDIPGFGSLHDLSDDPRPVRKQASMSEYFGMAA